MCVHSCMHNVCVFDVCVYVCAGVNACACVFVHTSVNVGVSVRRLHVRTQINMHVSARITLVIESPTFFPRRINGRQYKKRYRWLVVIIIGT